MKTSVKILIGAGLFILLAGSIGICIHHTHKNRIMRSMHANASFQARGMNQRGMRGNNRMAGMPMRNGMRPGMEAGPMGGMRRGRAMGEMNGAGRGMGPGQMNGMGRGMGPDRMNGAPGRQPMAMNRMGRGNMGNGIMMGNIPNLTEKQRTDIADLRKQQLDEMNKLRDDMNEKMQNLRETHRKKVMNLLTAEQKKAFESNTGIVKPASTK
jgi:hypothetical protein